VEQPKRLSGPNKHVSPCVLVRLGECGGSLRCGSQLRQGIVGGKRRTFRLPDVEPLPAIGGRIERYDVPNWWLWHISARAIAPMGDLHALLGGYISRQSRATAWPGDLIGDHAAIAGGGKGAVGGAASRRSPIPALLCQLELANEERAMALLCGLERMHEDL